MSSFHFLRAEYLGLLLPSILLIWWLLKQQNDEKSWESVIDEKLLKHLLLKPEVKHSKVPAPWHLGIVLTLLVLAISGPSWKLKESAFLQDDTNVALIVSVKKSMLKTDISPSRLARVSLKIEDFLKLQSNSHITLLAYSGSAHLVLPLTKDKEIIKIFSQALDPKIMPIEGDSIQDALLLAQKQLTGLGGSIIVLTDSLSVTNVKMAQEKSFKSGKNVILWQIASEQLSNEKEFERVSSLLGAAYVKYKADNSDIKTVNALVGKNFKDGQQGDSSKYEDGGYYLVPFIFLFLLLWARQGFVAELWRRA